MLACASVCYHIGYLFKSGCVLASWYPDLNGQPAKFDDTIHGPYTCRALGLQSKKGHLEIQALQPLVEKIAALGPKLEPKKPVERESEDVAVAPGASGPSLPPPLKDGDIVSIKVKKFKDKYDNKKAKVVGLAPSGDVKVVLEEGPQKGKKMSFKVDQCTRVAGTAAEAQEAGPEAAETQVPDTCDAEDKKQALAYSTQFFFVSLISGTLQTAPGRHLSA
jgi:hypothetical protein